MELKFVIYTDFSDRQARLKQLVTSLEEQGTAVQVIHASTRNSSKLAEATGLAVMSKYEAHFTKIDAPAIVFVDGDLVDKRLMDHLSEMDKVLYFLVPQEAIPPIGPGGVIKALLDSSAVIPALQGDEELPRTFGCHHIARSCRQCENLVADFISGRRDQASGIL